MYEDLKEDYANEPKLLTHLKALKEYALHPQQPSNLRTSSSLPNTVTISGSPQKVSFTSRYQRRDHIVVNRVGVLQTSS